MRETSPAALLVQGIHQAILELLNRTVASDESLLRQDSRKLARVVCPTPDVLQEGPDAALRELVDYVRQLCTATGGLVLILDQAEELLGSGLAGPDQELEREVLKVVGTLFDKEKRLKILLSLREEYLGRISLLVCDVEGLDKRIFRLDVMPRGKVRDVLGRASEVTRGVVSFENEAVIETILNWLGDSGDSLSGEDWTEPCRPSVTPSVAHGGFSGSTKDGHLKSVLIDSGLNSARFKESLELELRATSY